MMRRAALLAATTIAMTLPASAGAATFCVHQPADPCPAATTAGDDRGADLQQALSEAGASAGNTVLVGAGTFTSPAQLGFGATGPNDVVIRGAGAAGPAPVTELTSPATNSGSVLSVTSPGGQSSVSDLVVTMPVAAGGVGVTLNGTTTGIRVVEQPGATSATGVRLLAGSFGGTVVLDPGDAHSLGIHVVGNAGITHVRILGGREGLFADGPVSAMLDDALIRLDPSPTSLALSAAGGGVILANDVTLIGGGDGGAGAFSSQTAAAGPRSRIAFEDSIIAGFDAPFLCDSNGAGPTELDVHYTDFDFAAAAANANADTSGCTTYAHTHNLDADPAVHPPDFVGGGSFALRFDSTLIDHGAPAAITAPLDLAAAPRVADGDGDGMAVVDLGAFEYQRAAPTAVIEGVDHARPGQTLTFAAGASTDPDPGDVLAFAWAFDDGTTATGVKADHAFAATGEHTVTVTATDPTGLTGTATKVVTVATPPAPPTPTTPVHPVPPPSPLLPKALSMAVGDGYHASKHPATRFAQFGERLAAAERVRLFATGTHVPGDVRVAVGDLNGDGTPDILVGEPRRGGWEAAAFDGKSGAAIRTIVGHVGHTSAGVGVFVAAGDVNGDGRADIIVGADRGQAPDVSEYDATTGHRLHQFRAYPSSFTGGVRVAAADVDGDGNADIIAAPGAHGDGVVKVFSPRGAKLSSFTPYGATFTRGIFVAAGDVDGDGNPDIVTGSDRGSDPRVYAFDAASHARLTRLLAYGASFSGGVRVAVGDVDGDGKDEIFTVPGSGAPLVKVFAADGGAKLQSFTASGIASSGAWIAAAP